MIDKSLYTNIPNNEGIKAWIGMLEKDANQDNNTLEMAQKLYNRIFHLL